MAKPSSRTELQALNNLLAETDLILSTTALPENRTRRCRELLRAALALTGDLINQTKMPAAVAMGRKGGQATAQRGSDYFRQLALRRKTRAGGRPREHPTGES